jgi:hypothetical protein
MGLISRRRLCLQSQLKVKRRGRFVDADDVSLWMNRGNRVSHADKWRFCWALALPRAQDRTRKVAITRETAVRPRAHIALAQTEERHQVRSAGDISVASCWV